MRKLLLAFILGSALGIAAQPVSHHSALRIGDMNPPPPAAVLTLS